MLRSVRSPTGTRQCLLQQISGFPERALDHVHLVQVLPQVRRVLAPRRGALDEFLHALDVTFAIGDARDNRRQFFDAFMTIGHDVACSTQRASPQQFARLGMTPQSRQEGFRAGSVPNSCTFGNASAHGIARNKHGFNPAELTRRGSALRPPHG